LRKWLIAAVIIVIAAAAVFALYSLIMPGPQEYNWCIIEDVNGDRLKVEVADEGTWKQILIMQHERSTRWIGGRLIKADNEWGFTFDPSTVIVAELTAEGLQTTLQQIKDDPKYWFGFDICYVGAGVVETHEVS
jgi:hypothetical protein